MKKIIASVLAVLLLVSFFTACNKGKSDTLTVWCSELDKEVVTAMVAAFKASNTSVKEVLIEICEDDNARERFENDPASAADIICIPHDQLGALVAQGGLAEITETKHVEAISQNTAPSISAGRIDGKQYGFPSSFETHMLFYDKSIVSDAAVRSMDSILSCHVPDDGFHFAMSFGNAYFSANWFFTYGCRLFGEDGEDSSFCDFDSAGGVAAMTYVIEHNEVFGNLSTDEAIELFKDHKLGAYVGGPWDAGAITEALRGNYGCAALPSVAGTGMKSFAGFKLYCVNANTKNKSAAMDLAAWLTNPGNQRTRFQQRSLIPVASSLTDDADVAASATAKALMAQGPHAIAMPSIPEMSNFWTPTGELTLACYSGEIALPDLQARLSRLAAEIKGS